MVKIKFWDNRNIKLGFKILGADILTSISLLLPAWLIVWLIKTQGMLVLGVALALAFIFLNYHIKGFWARILGIRG